ncbi:UNVERIFIED_CONTAM: hypothetical protein HDU68_009721 [Siphonaria sp. JEL0065]|nr:hypothetical protein HDU68_009721 [Siphonaria sp. JEL0065]
MINPDLQDYPFVPDEARVIQLDYNWNLDEDGGDDVKSNVPSNDELFEEHYSQKHRPPETDVENLNDDEVISDVLLFTI